MSTYAQILRKRGLRYCLHELWQLQPLRFVTDIPVLRAHNLHKAYRHLRTYRHALQGIAPAGAPAEPNPYPNKIWTCWLQGVEQAPAIVQRCIASLKKYSGGMDVVVITSENMAQYVALPEYILRKNRRGIISNTHLSDILRISLLAEYGGIWADATVLLTDTLPSYILSEPLFCFKTSHLAQSPTRASNWFIAAQPHNSIVRQQRDILLAYWQEANVIISYFIFHLLLAVVVDYSEENRRQWQAMPYYNNVNPHTLQFELFHPFSRQRFGEICRYSSIHKLTYKLPRGAKAEGTFYEKIEKGEL